MTDHRVLVVEDDEKIAGQVAEYLVSEGFQVEVATDGPAGLERWRSLRPDLVVLDWMLPGMSGIELLRQIRQSGATPVIMLTARSEETDKLLGLELGADDYLAKPFSLRELAARVRAVLRRVQPPSAAPEADAAQFGAITVDFPGHAAYRAGADLGLTSTEFRLLATLARYPGRAFTRLQLLEAALGEYYEGYERTIDTHISRLRAKLGPDEGLVQTVHGVGYKLAPPRR